MKIQIATLDTLPFLYSIEQEVFDAESYPLSKRSFKTQLIKKNIYIATIDEKIIGYLLVLRYKHTLRIYSLGVLPEHRKQHIGYALISFIIQEAKKNGYRYLSLEVNTSNHAAIKLYEKLQFKTKKKLPHYYPKHDGIKMVLSLS